MADWRQKVRTISRSDGSTASETGKRAAVGCLSVVLFIISILTLIILFSLFRNGEWVLGILAAFFFIVTAGTAVAAFSANRD